MSHSLKFLGVSTALLLLGSAPAPVFADVLASRYIDQTAVVFKMEDLKAQRLPSRVHKHNVPVIFTSQINLACLGVHAQPSELIAYLPESRTCIPLSRLSEARNVDPGPDSFGGMERDRARLEQSLEENIVVVLQAQVLRAPANLCTCPTDNVAPVVQLTAGSPQNVGVGTPIAQIQFAATDVDSPVLTGNFSYSLDGGGSVAGLPTGLASNCVTGSGTLDCNVDGTAPVVTGTYLITLDVSDGVASGSATATLMITDRTERIFWNGFEDLLQ